jgi:hypothetical protein
MFLGKLLNGSIEYDSFPLSPITGIVTRYDMESLTLVIIPGNTILILACLSFDVGWDVRMREMWLMQRLNTRGNVPNRKGHLKSRLPDRFGDSGSLRPSLKK